VNTNLIHNILNICMIVVAGLAGFDFVGLGLDPILAGKIVAGLGTAKMIINVIRDGFAGLMKQQPPVK
jgi:small-conductance mechanosensitive channel